MFSVHLSVTLISTGADKAGTCLVIDSTSLFVIDTIAVFFVISASCMLDVSTCSLNRARRAHENDSSSGFFAGAMLVADNERLFFCGREVKSTESATKLIRR